MNNCSSSSSNSNKENVLDFKDLSEEEKAQYIDFLTKNNIVFENDNHQFYATIKLKNSKGQQQQQQGQQHKKQLNTFQQQQSISAQQQAAAKKAQQGSKQQPQAAALADQQPRNLQKRTAIRREKEELRVFRETESEVMREKGARVEQLFQFLNQIEIRPKSPLGTQKQQQQYQQNQQNHKQQQQQQYTASSSQSVTPSPIRRVHSPAPNVRRQRSTSQTRASGSSTSTATTAANIYSQQRSQTMISRPASSNSQSSTNNSSALPSQAQSIPISQLNPPPPPPPPTVVDKSQWLATSYPRVFQLLQFAELLRPSRWPRQQLLRTIEEIYAFRYARHHNRTSLAQAQRRGKCNNRKKEGFAEVVYAFFQERFKAVKTVEQNVLNLLASAELHTTGKGGGGSAQQVQADCRLAVFLAFLREEHTDDELSFYLFVRQMLEKTLGIKLVPPATTAAHDEHQQNTEISHFVSLQDCEHIALAVFGDEELELARTFLNDLAAALVQQNEDAESFDCQKFLQFSLTHYSLNKSRRAGNSQQQQQQQNNTTNTRNQISSNTNSAISNKNNSTKNFNVTATTTTNNDDISKYLHTFREQQNDEDFYVQPEEDLQQQSTAISVPPEQRTNQESSDLFQTPVQKNHNNHNNRVIQSSVFQGEATQPLPVQQALFSEDKQQQQNIAYLQQTPPAAPQRTVYEAKNELERRIMSKMDRKVEEFVGVIVAGNDEFASPEAQHKMARFEKILKKKTANLLESVFLYDKMRWCNLLMISAPSSDQLQHVETLQREFRTLSKNFQRSGNTDDIRSNDLTHLCKRILQTPELSAAIGELLVCITLPDNATANTLKQHCFQQIN